MKKVWLVTAGAFAALLTVIGAVAVLNGAKNSSKAAESKSLYEHGLDMVALLDEMVGNDSYVDMFSVSDEIGAVIEAIDEGDYSEPAAVYEWVVTEEQRNNLISDIGTEHVGEMSDALKKNLQQRLFASVVSQMNGGTGVTNLAASSICTIGKSFVSDRMEQDALYLYVYEDAQPIAVTFTAGEDGAVSASASFLMAEELKGATGQTFESYFAKLGMEIQEIR